MPFCCISTPSRSAVMSPTRSGSRRMIRPYRTGGRYSRAMKLSLITNDVMVARSADEAGIDRILIDLEVLGKAERQRTQSLFLSTHAMEDIPRVKEVLRRSSLAVRVDPPHAGSAEQIDRVIALGADYVLLPYFNGLREAADFVALVGARAVPVLLIERAGAVAVLQDLCQLPGVEEIHIGLNDLSLSLGRGRW